MDRGLEHYDLPKKIEIIKKHTRLSDSDVRALAEILEMCDYREIDRIIDALIVIARRRTIKL